MSSDKKLDEKVRFDLQRTVERVLKAASDACEEELRKKQAEYLQLYGADSVQYFHLHTLVQKFLEKKQGITEGLDFTEFERLIEDHMAAGFTAAEAARLSMKSQVGQQSEAPGFNDSIFDGLGARSTIEFNPDATPPPEPEPRPTSLPIPPDAEMPLPPSTSSGGSANLGPTINPDPELFGETKEKHPQFIGPDHPASEAPDSEFAPIEGNQTTTHGQPQDLQGMPSAQPTQQFQPTSQPEATDPFAPLPQSGQPPQESQQLGQSAPPQPPPQQLGQSTPPQPPQQPLGQSTQPPQPSPSQQQPQRNQPSNPWVKKRSQEDEDNS